jgi:hypothetical protein
MPALCLAFHLYRIIQDFSQYQGLHTMRKCAVVLLVVFLMQLVVVADVCRAQAGGGSSGGGSSGGGSSGGGSSGGGSSGGGSGGGGSGGGGSGSSTCRINGEERMNCGSLLQDRACSGNCTMKFDENNQPLGLKCNNPTAQFVEVQKQVDVPTLRDATGIGNCDTIDAVSEDPADSCGISQKCKCNNTHKCTTDSDEPLSNLFPQGKEVDPDSLVCTIYQGCFF